MARVRTKYVCQECGHEVSKWMGRCPGCDAWNTLVEETVTRDSRQKPRAGWQVGDDGNGPLPISRVTGSKGFRRSTGLVELDRVLGGGIVPGSLVLVGGDPGIGKSTLLLQVASFVASTGNAVLYASGEESVAQIRLRAERLQALSDDLLVVTESDVERVAAYIATVRPALCIVDSIQTMVHHQVQSAPGSVSQVRECTACLMGVAKQQNVPVFLVGHVNKGGSIAGPKVLEHAVDTVLHFEGEFHTNYRILRAVKNRFGSTNEIGVFQMGEEGLSEVSNPSSFFLAERPAAVAGSVVTACMEGTRPLLVEIQALVGATPFGGTPRRQSTGVDPRRLAIVLAVLEKRCGLQLQTQDVYANAAGGVRAEEPAVDLAMAAAVASSFRNVPVSNNTVVMGEIGLAGEVRSVRQVEQRIREAAKLDFRKCVLPHSVYRGLDPSRFTVQLVAVGSVAECLEALLPR